MNLSEQKKIYTVSEITAEIKQILDGLGVLWIEGEISNFKHHTSGHMYFSLKDERAHLKAAFFRSSNLYLKFRPEDGLVVIVRGRISVYEPRGDYQIIVEYMEPRGVGSLQLAFEQLKEKLRGEGLFDETHKVPLPLLPHKVGIVTSPTGAAIRDILRVLKRRNASLHVLLYPARVQGVEAPDEITAGLRYLNTRQDIDVIIVGRGGGSIEDLWAFNEEAVARAIHQSRIPVVSAVGHEVDFTIADFVADVRAATPSAAAEMVSGARDDLRATVTSLHGRLVQAARHGIGSRRLQLERLAHNRAFSVTPNMIRDFQQRFDEAALRMGQAVSQLASRLRQRERILQTRLVKFDLLRLIGHRREVVARNRQHLISLVQARVGKDRASLRLATGRLQALSPLAILERGYAICRDSHGTIVTGAASVSAGDRVSVSLARGELDCLVEGVKDSGQSAGAV